MPSFRIADLDDPRVGMYRHLKDTNQTRHSGQFVVEGEKLVDRLLTSRFPVASVLCTGRFEPELASRVPSGTPLFVIDDAKIGELVGYNFHRGVLACGVRTPWPEISSLATGPRATLLVCPRIDNPENLGAIARIADVFGVEAVLVGPRCPDPLSRRVLRVSMGSALAVPILVAEDLAAEIVRLRDTLGFETVGTVVDPSASPLEGFQRPSRLALFLGSEGHGLEPEWLAVCDRRLTIPMRPGAESLNVAVAAGILLYHLTRQSPTSL
jgi:tRNA G18 (ribose-2'-O)-methylase SpoU